MLEGLRGFYKSEDITEGLKNVRMAPSSDCYGINLMPSPNTSPVEKQEAKPGLLVFPSGSLKPKAKPSFKNNKLLFNLKSTRETNEAISEADELDLEGVPSLDSSEVNIEKNESRTASYSSLKNVELPVEENASPVERSRVNAVWKRMNTMESDFSDIKINNNLERLNLRVQTCTQEVQTDDLPPQEEKSETESLSTTYFENGLVKPQRLFENFIVTGIPKEHALKYLDDVSKDPDSFQQEETIKFKGAVLYSFAESQNLPEALHLDQFERIVAPKGYVMTRYTDTDADLIIEKVLLKKSKKYKNRQIVPLLPHIGKMFISKWEPYAESLNPHNRLYLISITKGDYLKIEKNGSQHVIYGDTVYSFLTYYPLPQLFFGMLESILTFLRRERKTKFLQSNDLNQVDFCAALNILESQGTKYIEKLFNVGVPRPMESAKYEAYDLQSNHTIIPIEYQYPEQALAWIEGASWNSTEVFDKLGLEDLIYIMSAILQEKHVVFLSENNRLLTSTINSVLGLLYPFKAHCNLATSLSTDNLALLECPVSAIFGINRDERYFWREDLYQHNCIFIFLDQNRIYANSKNPDLAGFPLLSFIKDSVKEVYKKVGSLSSNFKILKDEIDLRRDFETRRKETIKKLLSNPSSLTQSTELKQADPTLIKELFCAFRDTINEKIIKILDKLSRCSISKHGQEVASQLINQNVKDSSIREFFYSFRSTMYFNNYPEFITSCLM